MSAGHVVHEPVGGAYLTRATRILLTLVALGVVVLVTATGITLLLARQADRALDDLLRAHGTRSRWRSPGLTLWRSWTTRNV